MPISVSTFAAGATIDADAMRSRAQTIERYVNNEIAAGDRGSFWLHSGHVYTPDFQYAQGYDAHLPMTGGHAYWSQRPNDDGRQAVFSYYMGVDPTALMVAGLTRTVQIPESLAGTYRAVVLASFWAYEYGGEGPAVTTQPYQEETTVAAKFALYADGTKVTGTTRNIYTASCALATGGNGSASGEIYCRKQITMMAALGSSEWSGAGVHTVGVGCLVQNPAGTDQWRHIFVREGSFYVRYRIR